MAYNVKRIESNIPIVYVRLGLLETINSHRYLIQTRNTVGDCQSLSCNGEAPIWREQNISTKWKTRLMRCLVMSVFLHVSETRTLSVDLERKLNSLETRCNGNLLMWSGHVTRLQRSVKVILQGEMKGERERDGEERYQMAKFNACRSDKGCEGRGGGMRTYVPQGELQARQCVNIIYLHLATRQSLR